MESLTSLKAIFPGLSKEELSRVQQLRHRARTDHFFLANEILGFEFVETVHRGLFDAMIQKDPDKSLPDQDRIKNRLILWSRGVFKTSAEVVEIVQLILCFPNIRILIMSGTENLTKSILGVAKKQFEANEKLAKLFPEYCGKNIVGNTSEFTVRCRTNPNLRDSTVSILTLGSTKAGSHFDVIFCDDVVNEINSKTPELIESTKQAYLHVLPLLDPQGYIYLIGTRYDFADLYGWTLDILTDEGKTELPVAGTYQLSERWAAHNHTSLDGQWYISVRPCWHKYFDERGTVTHVDLLFPERLTLEFLQSRQKVLGDLVFSAQYENSPILSGSQTFTEELLDSHLVPFEQIPKRGQIVVIWDLASSIADKADDSVGIAALVGPKGKVYIIDCIGGKFDPFMLVQTIVQLAWKHRAMKIVIEKANGAENLLPAISSYCAANRVQPLPIEFVGGPSNNKKGAKVARVAALQTILKSERLFFMAGLPHWEQMRKQFLRFPGTRHQHDDYTDVVGMLMESVVPYLATPFTVDNSGYNNLFVQQSEANPAFEEAAPLSTFGSLGGNWNG